MKRVKADLTIGPLARDCRVVLDGTDISGSVRSFTLTADAHEVTMLTLQMHLLERQDVSGEVFVELSPESEEMLLHLGWTPPPPNPA